MRAKAIRILVAILAGLLLLAPGFLTAWGLGVTLNLEIALAAIVVSVLVAIWLPKFKWVSAVIASLLIAIPPYPHWLYSSEERGLYLHFFHGYTMKDISIGTYSIFFFLSMLLFGAIYWAIGNSRATKP